MAARFAAAVEVANGVAAALDADPGVPGKVGTRLWRVSVDGADRSTSIASARPPMLAVSKILPRDKSTPKRSRMRLSNCAAAKE